MSTLNRTRGLGFEREVAKQLRGIFPKAKRHLEFQIDEAAEGRDLTNTGPLAIQCKRGRQYAPITKLFEVRKTPDNIPLLVTRADDKKALCALYFDDFLYLIDNILKDSKDLPEMSEGPLVDDREFLN